MEGGDTNAKFCKSISRKCESENDAGGIDPGGTA